MNCQSFLCCSSLKTSVKWSIRFPYTIYQLSSYDFFLMLIRLQTATAIFMPYIILYSSPLFNLTSQEYEPYNAGVRGQEVG